MVGRRPTNGLSEKRRSSDCKGQRSWKDSPASAGMAPPSTSATGPCPAPSGHRRGHRSTRGRRAAPQRRRTALRARHDHAGTCIRDAIRQGHRWACLISIDEHRGHQSGRHHGRGQDDEHPRTGRAAAHLHWRRERPRTRDGSVAVRRDRAPGAKRTWPARPCSELVGFGRHSRVHTSKLLETLRPISRS